MHEAQPRWHGSSIDFQKVLFDRSQIPDNGLLLGLDGYDAAGGNIDDKKDAKDDKKLLFSRFFSSSFPGCCQERFRSNLSQAMRKVVMVFHCGGINDEQVGAN
jgi:hypothetical protein